MIGVPQPNPRDTIISTLNNQLDHFFGAGGTVQEIARGVSADKGLIGSSGHADRLRAERNKLAPKLKAMAEQGMTASQAATATGIRSKRVELIGKENGFTFASPK